MGAPGPGGRGGGAYRGHPAGAEGDTGLMVEQKLAQANPGGPGGGGVGGRGGDLFIEGLPEGTVLANLYLAGGQGGQPGQTSSQSAKPKPKGRDGHLSLRAPK
jgi:hypothetical protein